MARRNLLAGPDPDAAASTNPLVVSDPYAAPTLGQPASSTTTAAAYDETADAISRWLAAQRAQSAAMGLYDPATGLPTPRGMAQAGQQVGSALLGGTMAPGTSLAGGMAGDAANPLAVMGSAPEGQYLQSRLRPMYNPPTNREPIPFDEAYKSGATADAAGRLTTDMEGRPLTARNIAGRTLLGGADEAIPPAAYDAISEAAIGTRPAAVASRAVGGDAGRFVKSEGPGGYAKYNIYVNQTMNPFRQTVATAHELGHMVDTLSGEIPTDGLVKDELKQMYSTLNTGSDRTTQLFLPQHDSYKGAEIPREYMAEAIRAYMTNPNWLKSVAPQTAERIRQYVNANPRLSPIIQFNSAAGLAAGGAAAGGAAVAGQQQP